MILFRCIKCKVATFISAQTMYDDGAPRCPECGKYMAADPLADPKAEFQVCPFLHKVLPDLSVEDAVEHAGAWDKRCQICHGDGYTYKFPWFSPTLFAIRIGLMTYWGQHENDQQVIK